jgi:hypothetical protein
MNWYADGTPWGGPSGVPTSARVDLATSNNATWQDAFQFDPTGSTGAPTPNFWPPGSTGPNWTLTPNHLITIKGNRLQTVPLMTIDSGKTGCQLIVIDDAINRILHTNVSDMVLTGVVTGTTGATGQGLIPGTYVYDWIMYDNSVPPIRTALMHGKFVLSDGVGGE